MVYFIGGWFVCALMAFGLFVSAWRNEWNVELDDAIFFSILSLLGPISLICACVVWLMEWATHVRCGREPIVLWRKR